MKQAGGIRQRQQGGGGGNNRKFANGGRQRHMAGGGGASNPYGPHPHGQHALCPEVAKALSGVMLIAEQKKRLEESTKVRSRQKELANTIVPVAEHTSAPA